MDHLDRPIFIVGPPQSGATFLFDALGASPEVRLLGTRGRAALDLAEEVDPAPRGYDSNRRTATDATPETAARLRADLRRMLEVRARNEAGGDRPLRLLDATPRHALRVPFLDAVFPDATFVYVYREPRDTVAGMVEVWGRGPYVTYPELPGWSGPPWSLLLVPGWRELAGKDVPEIATQQWLTATRTLLDDLDQLPPERWCVADFAALAANTAAEIERICSFLDLEPPTGARHGDPTEHVASPSPAVALRHAERLQGLLPRTTGLAEWARDLLAAPISKRPTPTPDAESPLRSVYTGSFSRILGDLGGSLLVTSYETDKLIVIRRDGPRVNTHFRALPRPTGIAADRGRLAIGTRAEIHSYRARSIGASELEAGGGNDAVFMPHGRHYTGDIAVHELAYLDDELWLVATAFSCLATLDAEHSFVPRWRPPFVSELADEDRCHLTGLAPVDGGLGFVTALGETDTPGGWRDRKLDGGCAIDARSGEVVARGLSLPHSPRWHDGRLWLLESGDGALCTLDPASGEKTTVIRLPGFARGLALSERLAFVGLSRLRAGADYAGLAVAEHFDEHFSGICIIDIERGVQLGFLRFEDEISEVFDVAWLPGLRFPEIADPAGEPARHSFALPSSAV